MSAPPAWDVPARFKALTGAKLHAALALCGAAAALGQAPFFLFPFYALGLVAMVWALDSCPPDRLWAAYARGLSFGFGFFLAGLYWISSAFVSVDSPAWLTIAGTLALPLGLAALFWGPAALAARFIWVNGPRRIAAFALCFGLAELARATLFTGFPWNLPSGVWPAGGSVSQLASIFGAHGLGLLTLLALAAPATLGDHGAPLLRRAGASLLAVVGLGLAFGWGAQRLAAATEAPAGPVVRVVDAGFSQKERWEVGAGAVFARYLEMSADPRGSAATVVIWPESAVPGAPLLEYPDVLAAIGERLGDRVLLTGLVRREPDGEAVRYFNSLAVLDAVQGRLSVGQIYDKHHLVPFGEYIPFWSLVSDLPIAPLQQIGSGFTPGHPPGRLFVPGAPPASPLICYEAIFAGFSPRGADRPEWLVNVSIDSWYGRGTGPYQHANQARYRSIEEGLPLARAAAGGVSGVFDSYGREVVATSLDGGAVEASLPAAIEVTAYARFDWQIVTAVLLGFLLIRFSPGRKRGPSS